MKIKNKKRFSIVLAIGILLFTGGAFALNGWFGGGGNVPSDTLTRGLVSYWNFDEGASTTVYDTSGAGNNGTLTNISATSSWVQGKIGGALSFDGKNDFVTLQSNGLLQLTNSDFTVESWVKLNPSLPRQHQTLITIGDVSGGVQRLTFWAARSATNEVSFYNGATEQSVNSNTILSADRWYHVAFVVNASKKTVSFYIDGKFDTESGVMASLPTFNGTARIGYSNISPEYLSGSLDETRIYSRALSAQEIRYHYNRGGPVAWWRFDEGMGTTTYDGTENNNNGTLTNMSATSSWAVGRYGSALSFDGADDYVNAGSGASLNITQAITMEAWVKGASNLANGAGIVWKSNSGGTTYIDLRVSNKRPAFILYDGTNNPNAVDTSGFLLNDNIWHYIVGVRDYGNKLYLYVDGVLKKVVSDTAGAITANTVNSIGAYGSTPSAFWNGLIDDVRIYNYARTGEEIRLDYSAGFSARFGIAPGSCDRNPAGCMDYGLAGYWNMDESSGPLVYDKSNNGNDGVFNDGGSGNPVAYWTFDEGAGTTTYDYIALNHGTLGNGTTATTMPGWTPNGKVGGALTFDGNNDYVVMADSASLRPNAASVAAWFKVENTSSFYHVVHRIADAYLLNLETASGAGRKIRACFTNTLSSSVCVESDNPALAGNWYYAVGTWDGTTVKLYVNGVLQSTTAALSGTLIQTAGSTWVGTKNANQYFWPGEIDDVRIYNYARGATQIQRDYLETYKSKYAQGAPAAIGGKAGGYQGTALQFDGVDDFFLASSTNLNIGGPKSAEVWFRANNFNFPPTGAEGIFVSSSNNFGAYVNPNGALMIWARPNGDYNPSYTIAANTWYHLILTYDGATTRLYMNGELKYSNANAVNAMGNSFWIGSDVNGTGNLFNGLVDEVRLYGRALSAEEVRYHYNKSGPVAWWRLDEGMGTTTADATWNSNNGTLTNMSATTSWEKGRFGSALLFDGVDDYLTVGYSSVLSPTTSVSWSAWIKTGTNSRQGIMARSGNQFQTENGLVTPYVRIGNDSSYTDYGLASNKRVDDNKWHFVAATYQSGDFRIYVDGAVDKRTSGVKGILAPQSASAFEIGRVGAVPKYFNGLIDDARLYDYARSAEQIWQDYNAGLSAYFGSSPSSAKCSEDPGKCMDYGLAGYWNMDESSGPLVYDKSNNGNDGVFNDGGSGNPVAYWTFDEGAGTTTYDYIAKNHGTLSDGTTATTMPSWTPNGKVGGALEFYDGRADYVNVSDPGTGSVFDITSAITVETWVKVKKYTDYGAFLNKGNAYMIRENAIGAAGQALWSLTLTTAGWTNLSSASANDLPLDAWAHVVGTFNGTVLRLYINGKENASSTVASDTITADNSAIVIGRYTSGLDKFSGLLDDVRIYNYARGATQIQQDYLETYKAKYAPGAPSAGASGLGGGYQGTAFNFDGTNDFVEVPDSSTLDIFTDITIETWVKANATSQSDIIEKGGCNGYMIFLRPSNGKLEFSKQCDAGSVAASAAISAGRWYHVVATKAGSVGTIYLDGVQSGQDTSFADFGDTGTLTIGKGTTGDGNFNGLIDEVRIYNRALSAEEVRYHYNKSGPVAYWKLDEGASSTAFDATLNNNDGTLTNMNATTSWVKGKYGSALVFDGVNDYVDAGSGSTIDDLGAFTYSLWIKQNAQGSLQKLWDKNWKRARVNANGTLQTDINAATVAASTVTTNTVTPGIWTHIVLTYNDSGDRKGRFYINGVEASYSTQIPASGSLTSEAAESLKIGADSLYFFNGLIDDMRIYNYARTPAQIMQDYNAGLSTYFK